MKWEDMVDENHYKTAQIEELREKIVQIDCAAAAKELGLLARIAELETELKTARELVKYLATGPVDPDGFCIFCYRPVLGTRNGMGDSKHNPECPVVSARAFLEAHHD